MATTDNNTDTVKWGIVVYRRNGEVIATFSNEEEANEHLTEMADDGVDTDGYQVRPIERDGFDFVDTEHGERYLNVEGLDTEW